MCVFDLPLLTHYCNGYDRKGGANTEHVMGTSYSRRNTMAQGTVFWRHGAGFGLSREAELCKYLTSWTQFVQPHSSGREERSVNRSVAGARRDSDISWIRPLRATMPAAEITLNGRSDYSGKDGGKGSGVDTGDQNYSLKNNKNKTKTAMKRQNYQVIVDL